MRIAALYISYLMVVMTPAWAAENVSSAQALDQLRLLQRSLAKESPNMVKDQVALGPKTPVQASANPPKSVEQLAQVDKSVAVEGTAAAQQRAEPEPPGLVMQPAIAVPDEEAQALDDLAFKGVASQLFPLNPEKIHVLKEKFAETEYAKAASASTPPKPTATSQFVNLSPGSTPPVIRLAQGFVSSLVFLDSTGAPWPIAAFDLGDPTSFGIQWDKTSNTLMIQATKMYNYGNLAVRLVGLNTPVMLTLIPGQKAVDYRVDLRVQGYGPNAKSMPMEEGLPPSASDILLHVLDGVPPTGSARLIVNGGDARAWLLDNKMFIRTNLTILSPGWIGSMTSADGMHAYEMLKSPVLLVSWHGKVMQLKIEGL
ncbi:MAG: DotH/IcmK family type IV secretion protein [Legionellales bacterium]|nr:DotH/IcmK family type IV secretion protein [Legionellales bacterium]